ncbi:VCBS domain-containing protein [Variovorax sp. HJSM1_2]|uniref:VCBS domain-containing protein n=1 Tax=Variovorax sp. HJSM1_2 TaxID=3366263 RepID=UPI003BE63AB8
MTTLSFDIAASLRNAGLSMATLVGDLAADSTRTSATMAVISYTAQVGQSYTPPTGNPQSEINEGDELGNNAVVTGTLLESKYNLTGFDQSDGDSTVSRVPSSNVDVSLVNVNGGAVPSNGELRPGDLVTFQLSYDLSTGDYENFVLTAYLPLPLFDLSGVSWSTGSAAGQWLIGPGNTNTGGLPSISSGAGNSVVFDFGNHVINSTTGSRVELRFTLRVADTPFADQRALTVLAQSSQTTSIAHNLLISSDAVAITSIAEPVLNMTHGVVSASNGSVTGTTGSWASAGSGGAPFSGSITELSAIDGKVSGIDAGDIVRMATAIENTGGGGAFDVVTSITLPTGISFVGGALGSANLKVYRGDGTQLLAGQDYSVSGNTITFLDANGAASLLAGRAGTAADTSGANLVVITYDTLVAANIDAARTLQSSATLSNYASVNNGADFSTVDLSDLADQQIAAPEIRKTYAGGSLDNSDSSATHTTGNVLVVGESMLYDIVVTLPEGVTQTLRIDDLIPAGMRLDTSAFGGLGYQIITTTAGSAALSADFNGAVSATAWTAISGTLGDDGGDVRLAFSAAGATADNLTNNNQFVIRLRLVVDNVSSNQSDKVLQNTAQLRFSDPDTDTANGASPTDRLVDLTGGAPTVVVAEPTITISQALLTPTNGFGFDEGALLTFNITLKNSSAYNAFDITLADVLPTELDGVVLLGVVYTNATHNTGTVFEIVGGQLRSASGANIDIAAGGTIVLTVQGIANASVGNSSSFSNTATVQWTSLDGSAGGTADPAGERTGVDGLLNSGVLNDYRDQSTLVIPTLRGIGISRVGGLDDTAPANPTNGDTERVTVGEIVRYRVVSALPEGVRPSYQIQITLQEGLNFIPTAQDLVLIGLISDNGELTSSYGASLITSGTLAINGDQNVLQAGPIATDLSSPATGLLSSARITVSADGRTITFDLGTMTNNALNDGNLEGLVIEFNVVVSNIASVQAGSKLGVTARDYVDAGATFIGQSKTVYEEVVEPSFSAPSKTVTQFNPNPAGTTGSATVEISFTGNGLVPAYDTHLTDGFAGGSNYVLQSLTIAGTTYNAGNLPAGVTLSTSGGISLDFDQIDPGTAVKVVYTVTVPNTTAITSPNAVLTWSSLPEDFVGWGGSPVGADGSASGERTGTGGVNDYILSDGAGLGMISGTLWNDTASADGSSTPDGVGLAGQTVTLTWAGADGNLATTADNAVFTTTTAADGTYRFGVLPSGVYQVDTPTGTVSYPQPVGSLRIRIDSDGGSLGSISVVLGEGATVSANAGYVEQNDAPVNIVPGAQSGTEDLPLAISGLQVSDLDADRDPNTASRALQVTLTVLHGSLTIGTVPGGLSLSNNGTAQVTLNGTVADINTALASLVYLGNTNYNGADTLTIKTDDLGNFGDANGNGLPGEAGDALTDTDTVALQIAPVNDAPVANADSAAATEAGGTFNDQIGLDPRGNLFVNDTDVDIATNGDSLHLVSITANKDPGSTADDVTISVAPNVTAVLVGRYGTLEIDRDGTYHYIVDNTNAAVQALRLSGDTLVETFTYVVSDLDLPQATADATATLTVTIHGANDSPVAQNDTGSAIEAGGVMNGTAGTPASGNVLTNDTDVDAGDSKTVTGIRSVPEATSGPLTPVPPGAGGATIAGLYGSLTILADGSYSYTVNDSNATVQALSAGQSLTETFSYQVTDTGGLNDAADLVITIQGRNDAPVATNDVGTAQAGANQLEINEINPTGNVITLPSRPGTPDQAGGNGIDYDLDGIDKPNTKLLVDTVEATTLGGVATTITAGTTSANAPALLGKYGSLYIGADGSYRYNVDSTNADVIALPAGVSLSDVFTYQIKDTEGNTAQATLTITVRGVNDPPRALPAAAIAVERGGVNNGTAGIDPTGTVLVRTTDPDGDPLRVSVIQNTGGSINIGVGGQAVLNGLYGTLTINADGTYSYAVNNGNATVEALRQSSDQLVDAFTFTILDINGATDSAQLFVLVRGANDTPVAKDNPDAGDPAVIAVESGGVNNSSAGINPSGNVLTNDVDVDAYGETRTVVALRTGAEAASGTAGVLGTELRGTYGWVTLNSDGSYNYRLDNASAAVQALRAGDSVTDTFTYTVADTLNAQDRAALVITIQGSNDTPVATNDTATAVEQGGVNNATAGLNPTGSVLSNDTDVDSGEVLSVGGVKFGNNNGTVGSALAGAYGSLVLNANGSYTYTVDNNNTAVQALRTNASTLTEVFTYAVRDNVGATSQATLTITIRGQNDNPVANTDVATAMEAGGVANATLGSDPSGNLLTNDTDVDASDSKAVNGIRLGVEAGAGSYTAVTGTTVLTGNYGSLTIDAQGQYTYVVDNNLAAVQALRGNQSLTETFTYRMSDTAGATDAAELRITILGAWDTPVAANDIAYAVAQSNTSTGINPTGNVLANDTDIDQADPRAVNGIRPGTEGAGGALDPVAAGSNNANGTLLTGTYGQLLIGADGTFQYFVDSTNPTIVALGAFGFVTDVFTYQVSDQGGQTDLAQLSIVIRGRNEIPIARPDFAGAVEAGGVLNTTPGVNPTGNVLSNDNDLDGDALAVSAIRTGSAGGGGTAGTLQTALRGLYGDLTLNADGSYSYVVDNTLTAVQALRQTGETVTDVFTYTVTDYLGASSIAELRVTIDGRDDTPAPTNDIGLTARPANLSGPSVDVGGNVLTNDTDVDQGDVLSVSGGRGGAPGDLGIVRNVAAGTDSTNGLVLTGQYGQLTLGADGSYHYVVDSNNPTVIALGEFQTTADVFTYEVRDLAGQTHLAQLSIVIRGRNDAPAPVADSATAVEAGGLDNATPGINPTGNVLANDVDDDDSVMTVIGVVAGPAQGTPQVGVGSVIQGTYGTLEMQADGSWQYTIDNTLAVVQALRVTGQTVTDTFTYTVADNLGVVNSSTLVVTVDGRNDTPVAVDDIATATEASGDVNQTPGVNPTGNVLDNDTDVDSIANGESKTVLVVSSETGASANAGQMLQGRYGRLTLLADGSYKYEIDQNNRAVEMLEPDESLREVFTYRMRDANGLESTARLTVIIQGEHDNTPPMPPIPPVPGPDAEVFGDQRDLLGTLSEHQSALLGLQPAIFVSPVVEAASDVSSDSGRISGGSRPYFARDGELRSSSLGAGLGIVSGQFVMQEVRLSQEDSAEDSAWVGGRHGRIELSADGLLSEASPFTVEAVDMTENDPPADAAPAAPADARPTPVPATPVRAPVAQGFSAQLLAAAQRLRPAADQAASPKQEEYT